MASLKNAIKRRSHKERSQPESRAHLGLLEKKKDYKERAKEFQQKAEAIKQLRRQAEERNPDEFYFAMEYQETQDGIHVGGDTRGKPKEISEQEKKLLKTKDLNYILTKMLAEKKKIERLKASLHFLDKNVKPNQHIVFVDDDEEAKNFEPEEYFDTPAEFLNRTYNRPKKEQILKQGEIQLDKELINVVGENEEQEVEKQYKELQARQERYQQLRKLVDVLQQEKQLMGKGEKSLHKDENGNEYYVWAKQRKK
eukprot:TRINITY_DN3601_c0_g2_i2.p2 TRINITY_DN3601_c0_g2~~TRINITY_DN3601_c0_g2_i2.p2  ORF type:complete len:254 (-),score=58.84 TRINITY_DN3601_c0_g2_i2:270-1031(-)